LFESEAGAVNAAKIQCQNILGQNVIVRRAYTKITKDSLKLSTSNQDKLQEIGKEYSQLDYENEAIEVSTDVYKNFSAQTTNMEDQVTKQRMSEVKSFTVTDIINELKSPSENEHLIEKVDFTSSLSDSEEDQEKTKSESDSFVGCDVIKELKRPLSKEIDCLMSVNKIFEENTHILQISDPNQQDSQKVNSAGEIVEADRPNDPCDSTTADEEDSMLCKLCEIRFTTSTFMSHIHGPEHRENLEKMMSKAKPKKKNVQLGATQISQPLIAPLMSNLPRPFIRPNHCQPYYRQRPYPCQARMRFNNWTPF